MDAEQRVSIGTDQVSEKSIKKAPSTFRRVFTYALVRILTIGITIVMGVFFAVVVANKGEGLDHILEAKFHKQARLEFYGDSYRYGYFDERIPARMAELAEDSGLYDPFFLKHLKYTWNALRLDLGEALYLPLTSNFGTEDQSSEIKDILLDRLPNTLLLVGLANFFVFALGIPISLYLSRNYGNWIDKIINLMSPLSSVPSWVHGLLLILVLAVTMQLLPPGGMVDIPMPETPQDLFLSRLRHLILPTLSIFLSSMFQLVYTWRNFFMIYSNEDYVDLAVAKGLNPRVIQNKYILRPSLPYVITSFALTLVSFWQMTTALEVVFNWDGIGRLYISALPNFFGEYMFPGEMGLVIGIVVLFAYLLGFVVLLLDVAYAIVDPRIRLGGGQQRLRPTRSPSQLTAWRWLRGDDLKAKAGSTGRRFTGVRLVVAGCLLFGIVVGVLLAWGVWPVTFTDVSPEMLHESFRHDYMQMVIDSFNTNPDSSLARRRLNALGEYSAITLYEYAQSATENPELLDALNYFVDNYDPNAPLPDQLGVETAGGGDAQQGANAWFLWAFWGLVLVVLLVWGGVWVYSRWKKTDGPLLRFSFGSRTGSARQPNRLRMIWKELLRYPSAVAGLVILTIMVIGSLYAVIRYPYNEVGITWYQDASYNSNYVPKTASPKWINFFRKEKLPETIVINNMSSPEIEQVAQSAKGNPDYSFTFTFDFPYNSFPQEVKLYFTNEFESKSPFALVRWITPDGRIYDLDNAALSTSEVYDLAEHINYRDMKDHQLIYQLEGTFQDTDYSAEPLINSLFANPELETATVVSGTYTLQVDVLSFESDTEVDVELVVMGQVYGLAGTDYFRRDLVVPMVWGMPFALAIGLFGALITTVISMLMAAFGVWYGGFADTLVQRITEANMILPVVAIAVLFYAFYGTSLWTILIAIVILNAFGSPTKTFRAAFLQVKDASYIEAAQAYGATNRRIIFKYMIPRVLPVLIPQLVTLVPGFIFLEATLGMLNVKSNFPTWGKVIYEGLTKGAAWGSKFWVLEPLTLLLLTGFAFSMMGFALDRVLNPRLQEGD